MLFFSLKTYSHFTCMQWYIQQLEYKRNCCVGAAHVHVDALKIFWFHTLLNVRRVWMRCYLWLFRSVEHLASLVRWSRQTINARVQHILWDDVHCRVSSASPRTKKKNENHEIWTLRLPIWNYSKHFRGRVLVLK